MDGVVRSAFNDGWATLRSRLRRRISDRQERPRFSAAGEELVRFRKGRVEPWRSIGFFLLAICLGDSAGAAIRIGVVTCLTGPVAAYGQSGMQGARLAVEEVNRAGGLLGQRIELQTEDNQSKPGETATIVRKLIFQDHVVAILGDFTSSATLEGAPIAQAAGIPMLTPTATSVAVTRVGNYVFRTCFSDPFTGRMMARFALDDLRAKRAIIFFDSKQDYSLGVATEVRAYFTSAGGMVAGEFAFASGDTDFRAQLTSARGLRPDVFFVPAYYTEAGHILRQARQLGIHTVFVGGEGWSGAPLLTLAGKGAERAFYTNHFSIEDTSPSVLNFVHAYQNRYHTDPDAPAALWYDAAEIYADAIRRAGNIEPARIRDALAQTQNFAGVTGNITIDPDRNATKSGVIVAIEGGTTKMVRKVMP